MKYELNIIFGSQTSQSKTIYSFDARSSINIHEILCLYCASNSINLQSIEDKEFDLWHKTIENFVKEARSSFSDCRKSISFWIDEVQHA